MARGGVYLEGIIHFLRYYCFQATLGNFSIVIKNFHKKKIVFSAKGYDAMQAKYNQLYYNLMPLLPTGM